jgi:TRAP-type C4-dicarboxylate transport system permease small subunit
MKNKILDILTDLLQLAALFLFGYGMLELAALFAKGH